MKRAARIIAAVLLLVAAGSEAQNRQNPGQRITVLKTEPAGPAPRFGKFEIDFTLDNTTAEFPNWPYDPAPPNGIPPGAGVTADAVFINPDGNEFRQPAFYYQKFQEGVQNGRDWSYPTSDFVWKVRFSPNQIGEWKYKIVVQDGNGTAETPLRAFTVIPSSSRGFIRVSRADSRYFEFEDGALFTGLGFQFPEFLDDPITKGGPEYQRLGAYGINFVRLWISSLYGSAWNPWLGGRNRYAGYLPVAGLTPFTDEAGKATLTMQLDYGPRGDDGWFDACRLEGWNDADAVKPNTRYRVRATYRGRRITGPRNPLSPNYGFVIKMGGAFPNCYEPGTSRAVTGYGRNNSQWETIEGVWDSGNRYFLPKVHLALENVREGVVFLKDISIQEILPAGGYGPEILMRPSMEHQLYVPQARALAFDKIVQQAERNGVYMKLVVMEKADEIYIKTDDNGEFVTARDNEDGFYGTGRSVNKTRWLQQAWWRYLQARWGYSPNIHSWELTNEGDPASTRHYELADEFGKYMHYSVFGVKPNPSFAHPNDHLVTTSFWHSFPSAAFWSNSSYPNIDYADMHAYISTTFAPDAEKLKMQTDSAEYHLWHSQFAAAARVGKPVVRGEAGMDIPGQQNETVLGLQRDRQGIWLHDFLWSGLDSGGMYELYWWRSHIWNNQKDLRSAYRPLNLFLSDLALNKGGYSDWGGAVNNPALRVVGQKNVKAGLMHLWIQNSRRTWRGAAEGRQVEPVSGEIAVAGFQPGTAYEIEWWDTWARDKTILSLDEAVADAAGNLKITVNTLQQDVALKLRPRRSGQQGLKESDR
jgi:hypothetical protein